MDLRRYFRLLCAGYENFCRLNIHYKFSWKIKTSEDKVLWRSNGLKSIEFLQQETKFPNNPLTLKNSLTVETLS